MHRLIAQETLLQMRVADHPYQKPDGRQKFHRQIFDQAYPPGAKQRPASKDTLESFFSNLQGNSKLVKG